MRCTQYAPLLGFLGNSPARYFETRQSPLWGWACLQCYQISGFPPKKVFRGFCRGFRLASKKKKKTVNVSLEMIFLSDGTQHSLRNYDLFYGLVCIARQQAGRKGTNALHALDQ